MKIETPLRSPVVARTREELAAARAALSGRVAFVPTMGALHDGHAELMHVAHEHGDAVVVSIFVNPLQFGAGEDFDRYPRTFETDIDICAREGVALVWAPTPDVVYPTEPKVTVQAGSVGALLEGASRPGHFDGVLTVVAKLFNGVRPDVAVFGEKDAQQLALIRQMARDLDFGTRIVGVPTVREPDGLALSSRNRYLSGDERQSALALSRALAAGSAFAVEGPSAILDAALDVIRAERGVVLDYLVLVDEETFEEVTDEFTGPARLLIAARVGTTRLIDNAPLFLGTPSVG